MDILSQFLVPSSLNRPLLQLAAPPVRLALPSPRIAGLLTAGAAPQYRAQRTSSQDYLVFDRLLTWEQIQAQRGCSTREAMDAEIEAIFARGREWERQTLEAYEARCQARQQRWEQILQALRERAHLAHLDQEVRHEQGQ